LLHLCHTRPLYKTLKPHRLIHLLLCEMRAGRYDGEIMGGNTACRSGHRVPGNLGCLHRLLGLSLGRRRSRGRSTNTSVRRCDDVSWGRSLLCDADAGRRRSCAGLVRWGEVRTGRETIHNRLRCTMCLGLGLCLELSMRLRLGSARLRCLDLENLLG